MMLLTTTTHTTIVVINIVITLVKTHRHFSLRVCFLNALAFSSMTRVPSFQFSPSSFTSTSGVPSAGQNANRVSA
jgi:hypothetical protein